MGGEKTELRSNATCFSSPKRCLYVTAFLFTNKQKTHGRPSIKKNSFKIRAPLLTNIKINCVYYVYL